MALPYEQLGEFSGSDEPGRAKSAEEAADPDAVGREFKEGYAEGGAQHGGSIPGNSEHPHETAPHFFGRQSGDVTLGDRQGDHFSHRDYDHHDHECGDAGAEYIHAHSNPNQGVAGHHDLYGGASPRPRG